MNLAVLAASWALAVAAGWLGGYYFSEGDSHWYRYGVLYITVLAWLSGWIAAHG